MAGKKKGADNKVDADLVRSQPDEYQRIAAENEDLKQLVESSKKQVNSLESELTASRGTTMAKSKEAYDKIKELEGELGLMKKMLIGERDKSDRLERRLSDGGQTERATGLQKHGNDPTQFVEVMQRYREGIPPVILSIDGPDKKRADYAPVVDPTTGDAHYLVPLSYAQTLLTSTSGRKYELVSPDSLTVQDWNTLSMTSTWRKIEKCGAMPLCQK